MLPTQRPKRITPGFYFCGNYTKKAAQEMAQTFLKTQPLNREFESYMLSSMFHRYHPVLSRFGFWPTRFKKLPPRPGRYWGGYDLNAYLPEIGSWRHTSYRKCFSPTGIEVRLQIELRSSVKDLLLARRRDYPICERCGILPSEEVDHVKPEFKDIWAEAKKWFRPIELTTWETQRLANPVFELRLPEDHPAVQYVRKAHENVQLMAVCKRCHYLNGQERKAGDGDFWDE